MTNIDAGSQRIRRLPDKPIVGETYPNAGGIYKVDRYDAERDLAWVHRPKDGWKCCAHGPALYDVPGRGIELQWNYSTGASSVLTIAVKGGEAIMKPKKKSRLFQLPALPKAPWWLSLTIASVSLMVSVIALTR